MRTQSTTPIETAETNLSAIANAMRVRFVVSATAEDMERRVAELADQFPTADFSISNMDVAGAGEGHVFCTMIVFVDRAAPNVTVTGIGEDDHFFGYFVAASPEELPRASFAALQRITAAADQSSSEASEVEQMYLAGSAKGTRFMGMYSVEIGT